MEFKIKDIVKGNKAHFSFYRGGNMFYTVTVNGAKWISGYGTATRHSPEGHMVLAIWLSR